ncbi:MAG: O-antigen ligase family protein [Spirochaetales bacterium]|nr:O-antigen ligase family protein [Spirochaetales bacterium]
MQRWFSFLLQAVFSLAALTTLWDFESRRTLILENGAAALLILLSGMAFRLYRRQNILPAAARSVDLLALLLLLAFAAESAGYANRAMIVLVRLSFLAFCIYTVFRHESENISFTILLAGVLLPFTAGFFAWNGYLLAALWLLYSLTVLSREKFPQTISLCSFDFLLLSWILLFIGALFWAVNVQDALARIAFTITGMAILLLALRYPDFFKSRVAIIGCIYIAFYILVHIAGMLGMEDGYRVSKELKGRLITTQLAQHFMFFAPAFFVLKGTRSRLSAILALLSLVALLMTLARGSLLGFLCGMTAALAIALVLRARTKKQRMVVGLLSLLFFAFVALGIVLLRSQIEGYFQTWTMEQRLALWHMTFRSWLQTPIAGNGTFIAFNIFSTTAGTAFAALVQEHAAIVDPWIEPHNLYLALLLSGGILGFLSFLSIMGYIIVRSIKDQSENSLYLLAIATSFLVVGLTESLISTYVPLFLLWILWALARIDLKGRILLQVALPRWTGHALLAFLCVTGSPFFLGNLFIYRSQVTFGKIQTSVRGLPLLERPADAMLSSNVLSARTFAPLDWRSWQMAGEIAFARGRKAQDKESLLEALYFYKKATALNTSAPLLALRRAEIAENLKRYDPAFAAEEKAARQEAAQLDPYRVFSRYYSK